jgi:modification methylase
MSIIEDSKIDTKEYLTEKWYLSIWNITNVLPMKGRIEEGVAAFPEEIARRLIKLFTFKGENVLDPFLGSGTTMKVARELTRSCYGYEIDLELKPIILKKIGYGIRRLTTMVDDNIEVIERSDAKSLRTFLQQKIDKQKSVKN